MTLATDRERLYSILGGLSGVPPRKKDPRLERIADDRALEARYVVGTVIDGNDDIPHPIEQLEARTFPLQGTYKGVWENAAWSYGFADPIQSFADGWWNSAPHRANLVNPDATTWGIGLYIEAFSGGPNRYYAITEFTKDLVMRVYLASGENFPDAISAGPIAARHGSPVLLTKVDGLPASTKAQLQSMAPTEIVIVGGAGSVSDAVFNQCTAIAPTRRIGGADRYAVAVGVAKDG